MLTSRAWTSLKHIIAYGEKECLSNWEDGDMLEMSLISSMDSWLIEPFEWPSDDHSLQPFTAENGIPQGSVLAVSLFLIVMNSVFQHLPSGVHVFVYADDIVIVVAGPNATRVRRKIQSAIKMVFEWASRVGFQMSTEKCEITHCCAFRHNPMLRPVKVNDNAIPFRKAPKVIGVSLDRNLNFCQHFQRIKQEVKSRVQLVKTISSRHTCSNRHVLQRVANALICSKLLYGIEITYSGFENLI